MSYLNSVTLVGFVGADPEQRQARNNGSKFTVLSIATQRSWKNAKDEWTSKTEWHRLIAWGNLAKFAGTLKRGNHISAEGELRYRMISDEGNPKVERRLAKIHLAKIGKLDRGEQLVDELPAVQTDDQAT